MLDPVDGDDLSGVIDVVKDAIDANSEAVAWLNGEFFSA
jgi:hypothetical protein